MAANLCEERNCTNDATHYCTIISSGLICLECANNYHPTTIIPFSDFHAYCDALFLRLLDQTADTFNRAMKRYHTHLEDIDKFEAKITQDYITTLLPCGLLTRQLSAIKKTFDRLRQRCEAFKQCHVAVRDAKFERYQLYQKLVQQPMSAPSLLSSMRAHQNEVELPWIPQDLTQTDLTDACDALAEKPGEVYPTWLRPHSNDKVHWDIF